MSTYPAGWYPDPSSSHQRRYWDGRAWTEHVTDHHATPASTPTAVGRASATAAPTPGPTPDPAPEPAQPAPTGPATPDTSEGTTPSIDTAQLGAILEQAGVRPVGTGDGTLFGEPVLILLQRTTEVLSYDYVSPTGSAVGGGQELVAEKLNPAEASFGELMDHANSDRFALLDPSGTPWARLTHKKTWKSKATLRAPDGADIGLLRQENVLGKVKIGLRTGRRDLGTLVSDNTALRGFTVLDADMNTIGRIHKLGSYARPGVVSTQAVPGCYVLNLRARPPQPLHSLVVAAPLVIDLAFRPNQAGYRSLSRTLSGQ